MGTIHDFQFIPELLSPIDEPVAERLIDNDNFFYQRKRDGRRLAIRKTPSGLYGYNKLGQPTQIDTAIQKAFANCQRSTFLVDGEIEPTGWHGWDILELDGSNLRTEKCGFRTAMLLQADFHRIHPLIHIVPGAYNSDEKRHMVNTLHKIRAEGFCAKNRNATYKPGRAGQHFKVPFVTTASFIVGPKPKKDDHRSVALYLWNGDPKLKRLRYLGTVGVPDKYALPSDGDIIDVRYKHLFPGPQGHVYQPKFFGVVRDDVDMDDCVVAQLKLRASETEACAI